MGEDILHSNDTELVREHETGSSPSISTATPDPPDGGYGWVCVACCFTVNCFTWGVVAVSRHIPSRLAAALTNSL